jgi:hypothetical protein
MLKKVHRPVALAAWRGRKIASPLSLNAERVHDREKAYAALGTARQASLAFVESCKDCDLGARRFPHPVFGSP